MYKIVLLLFLVFCLGTASAQADSTLENIQDLSFGSFGLVNNDSQQTIIVTPDSDVTYDDDIVGGTTPPQAGEYLLDELTPDTDLGITIQDATLNRMGGGPSPTFTVSDFTHNDPTTDSNGDATLLVGGTLTTSGSGVYYETGTYSGTMELTIIF